LLEGLSLAGFPAIAMAYLNEEVSPGSVGRVMGIYVSGTAVGGFLGRVLISVLTEFFSWKISLLVLGLCSLGCSLLFWILLPKSSHFQPRRISLTHAISGFGAGLANKKLLSLYMIGFLLLGTYVTLFNYLGFPLSRPPYDLSQTVIGLLFVFQLVGSWSSIWFGRWADRYSRSLLILCGITCQLVGSLVTLYGNIWLTIVGITLYACGFFAGHTVASGWVGRIAPAGHKSQASSLYLLFYYTGSSLVGWLGGQFLGAYGWIGVVLFLCGLLLLMAALLKPLWIAGEKRASAIK
jgi:YNFM family putative membrane transporter